MPKAYAQKSTERIELKSVPDGFVVLKRMTYGDKLERQSMVKMAIELTSGKDAKGELALANKKATYLEFANCIVEHNLEKDDEGTLFNFKNAADVDALDPKIGEEIDSLISEMNNFESDAVK